MKTLSVNRSLPSVRKRLKSQPRYGMAGVLGMATLLSLFAPGSARAQTLAYYRFEEGIAGAQTAPQPAPIPDSSPGHNNPLFAFSTDAAPTYRSDNPGPVSNPTAPNTLSVDFSQATPFTRDLYTGGDPINTHLFSQFTMEAAVKFNSFGGFQTFLGRDGQNISGSGDPNASNLYFQSPDPSATGGQSVFSVRARQANGNFIILNGNITLVAGEWYNVAAVGDGNTLSLYVQTTPGSAYTLDTSTAFIGGLHSDTTIFTIGRGEYAGVFGDQFRGLIDEVRISADALSPSQFLFAPAVVPEPGSIALLMGIGTFGAGFLRRRTRSRQSV